MPVPSDGELTARAQAGDREAFEVLADRFVPRVRAFLYRLAGGASEIDDLAQEVFVVAIRGLSELRDPERFRGWLFGIAVRVHRARAATARWTAARRTPLDGIDVPTLGAAGDALEREGVRATVMEAVARLPMRLRETFLLRHVEELAPGEVAALLEVPEGTVRRWDFEARASLREILDGRGLGATRP